MYIDDKEIAKEQYMERVSNSYSISRIENRNPLAASSIEETVVLFHRSPDKALAEVKVEGQAYVFKWSDVSNEENERLANEKLNDFLKECVKHREKIIEIIRTLNLPCI